MIVVGLILGGILVLLMPTIGRMVGASVHSLDDCVIYGRWVAAMSVFGYIVSIFLSISYGFSTAIITIAGYKVGEKKKQEIHELLRRSTGLQILTGVVMGVLCWLLANPIATLYVGYDEATLGLAVKVLKISSVACLLYGFDTFCGAFFTGLGDGLGSIIIAFTLSLAAPVGFVLLLPAVWGAEAIWYLYPVFTLATVILCAGMLKWRYPAWMRHLERNGAS